MFIQVLSIALSYLYELAGVYVSSFKYWILSIRISIRTYLILSRKSNNRQILCRWRGMQNLASIRGFPT